MKYLTVCQGALLALSLAVVSTSAFAGDYGGVVAVLAQRLLQVPSSEELRQSGSGQEDP